MIHGSLFSGIGGFDLGFQRAGIKTIWDVEIEPYAQAVLRKNFPETEIYSDVREVGKHNLKPVDIISGGFPCQDISVAGKQTGIDGARSGLWAEMFRIVGELRPRFIVIENSPELARLGLYRVLPDLASIGYDAEWQNISAASIGAPHRRNRLYIIAYPNSTSNLLYNGTPPGEKAEFQKRLEQFQPWPEVRNGDWGISEADMGRTIYGIPGKLDKARVKGLGNAIMPQIAEIIGRRLMEL